MRKRILSIMLTICMALMLVPTAVFAEGGVEYRYCDENGKNWQTGTKTGYTTVTADDLTWGDDGNDGWYVAAGNVTIGSRVTVSGNVHLILTDGCKLTVNGGIRAEETNTLTIYAQSTGDNMGELIADASGSNNAGIGGNLGNDDGGHATVTITGGKITATAGGESAAIGGSYGHRNGGNGTVTINGGIVYAYSKGRGIGGGFGGSNGGNGTVIITGGTVTAAALGNGYTGGIGGGYGYNYGGNGTVTITGGTVTSTTSSTDPSIGGGYGYNYGGNGTVTITGGTVIATSTSSPGIGGGIGGGGENGANGTFHTNNGNAVIFTSSIADRSNQSNWSGIIFEGNEGKVYGTAVTPSEDFTIPTGKTLTIGENQTLTIPEGVTATNEGTIDNSGKIFVDGTFTGTADNLYYPLTLENATAAGDASVYNTKTYGKAGSEITLTPDTPTGYEFKQWNSVPTVTISENKFTMPGTAVKINALFDPLTYNVAFVLNGGTINSGDIDKYTYGQGATLPTDVTKAGYSFKGWYDNQALTGSPVTAISATETGEKEYWAKWEAKTFNVALNTNGGTINSGNITGYTYGQGAALPTDVTKAGYTFKGWYDNEELTGIPVTAISETETGEKKYWAKWEAKTFNVALDANGGTINSGDIDKYIYGQGAALPTDVTKAGYSFKGWYDNQALTGSPVTAISETETGEKEYWAKWEAKTYTVSFNTNGGNTINDKTVTWEDKVLEGISSPTKSGWAFMGWKCGNTAVTSYTTYGDLAENDTAAGITLTAHWRDTSIPTGGGSSSSNSHTCKDVSPRDHKCDTCGATLSDHSGGTATCTERAICEICGKPYGETDSKNHNLEKVPENEATADENGNEEYWHCEDCDKNFSDKKGKNEIELEDTIIPKLSPEIIEGDGQSVTKGERKALTFRSNAAFDDFIRVELDGKTLSEKNYTVKEGSTVVTLKADFVAGLSVGRHTLAIVSESGTATAEFTVYATAEETEEAEKIEEIEEIEDDDICPPTGYENMPLLTLMLVSGGTALISRKKKQSKNR
ncbi:MAG: InlB B-repeat-containing protein [Ruminiclostridium sp.]